LGRIAWFSNPIVFTNAQIAGLEIWMASGHYHPTSCLLVVVAVDANFIRWSFNSHVTALECNLLGSVVSRRIEIDRSRGPRSEIWRVSHCLRIWSHWTTNKTTLVRLLPIALPSLRLIRTWRYEPNIHSYRACLISMHYLSKKKFGNDCWIVYWPFLRAFSFVELIERNLLYS